MVADSGDTYGPGLHAVSRGTRMRPGACMCVCEFLFVSLCVCGGSSPPSLPQKGICLRAKEQDDEREMKSSFETSVAPNGRSTGG